MRTRDQVHESDLRYVTCWWSTHQQQSIDFPTVHVGTRQYSLTWLNHITLHTEATMSALFHAHGLGYMLFSYGTCY